MKWPLPPRALVGMVHVGALPGTPLHARPIDELARRAVAEARTLIGSGFDAVMLENMHDRPYVNGPHGPETTAAMTRVVGAVRDAFPRAVLGVQVLSLGHREALAVALATGAAFIRVENFAYAHIADEGLMPAASAGELLRYRRTIGAERIALLCDAKKKHASHAITADVSLREAARTMEFFGADGIVVTGSFTGDPTSADDVREAREATRLPVVVGSGVTARDAPRLLAHADALIVGSSIKRGGVWTGAVDPDRCRALVGACRATRRGKRE